MDRLAQDLHVVVRGLRRPLTFTATAAVILGVGIGMAAAMYSVFDAVLLRRGALQAPASSAQPVLRYVTVRAVTGLTWIDRNAGTPIGHRAP